MGEGNFKINEKQMEEVVEVLRKEDLLEDVDAAKAANGKPAAVSSVPPTNGQKKEECSPGDALKGKNGTRTTVKK